MCVTTSLSLIKIFLVAAINIHDSPAKYVSRIHCARKFFRLYLFFRYFSVSELIFLKNKATAHVHTA